MVSPDRLRRSLRRRLTIGAMVVASLTLTALIVPSAHADGGHDRIGGKITRERVIDRARTWVRRGIQYSQSRTARDAERHHRYRRDCSGFISMVWHIRPTGLGAPTTRTLDGRSHRIRKRNLRRGDILLDQGNHVVLFHKWANRSHTRFWLFEMSNSRSDMNHRVAYLSSYRGFGARRYNHITT